MSRLFVFGLILVQMFAFAECSFAGKDFFGGQTISFPLSALPSSCQKIRAHLYQRTSSFEVKSEEFIQEPCGADVKVALPKVRAKTDFKLEFEALTDLGWSSLGAQDLTAYPEDLLNPLRAWADQNELEVEDPEGKLEAFLENQGIPFLSSFKSDVESPEAVLKFGPREIRFMEEEGTVPLVRVDGQKVIVEMFFLDKLANNPAFQYELLKLFQQIL